MKYENPFIYKRPLYPGRDELVMIERRTLLEKTMTGLEFGHWFAISCGKKTGKTSFLLRLIGECKKRHPDYHFIVINLEELPKFSQVKLNKLLLQKVNELLSQKPAPLPLHDSMPLDAQEFKRLLTNLAERFDENSKIIFVLDSFETVPRTFAKETLQGLINLYQPPATCTPLAKFQFIVAGSLTLNDLLLKKDRSFSEYAMKVFVDDFRLEDIADMLNRVSARLNIPCQAGFARLLYEATGGMGYLVQKICYRILETASIKNETPELSLKNGDEAIFSIICEGETNVEMIIRQIEKDNNLVESLVRTLRAGAIKSSKFDHHLKGLVSLGALTERNGAYRIRNAIYKTIFQDYFTTERLADLYLSQKKYYRAKELFLEALAKQSDAQNVLEKLLLKGKTLGATVNQKNAKRNILQIFMKTVDGAQNCSLMMLEANRRTLKIVEAIGLDSKDINAFELKNGEGVAGCVAQTGRTRVIRNVTDEVECPEFVDREFAIRLNIGAMVSLPLQIADQVIGVINLCLSKPHEFTHSEVKMLEILAAQASIVLQNMPLYHSIERHQDYLEILQHITQDLANYLDTEIIFEKILGAVAKIAGTEKNYIIYRMAANDPWQFRFAGTLPKNGKLKLPALINHEGIASFVLETGEPYFAVDVRQDEHYFQIWDDIRSELAVPLLIDNEVNGCLVIASQAQAAFSEVQRKLISMLADFVGLAIKNHRLYGVAEKNAQQVITSKGIGEAISHEKALQEILYLIANECLNVIGYPNKSAVILLRDKERDKLMVQAVHGEAIGQNYVGKPAPEKSLAFWVLRQGKPGIVTNMQREPEYRGLNSTIRSEIAAPLIFGEEVIGVIDAQSTMPDDFDLPDQESLAALARSAAIAIANARLRDDLKKTQIDLAKALEAAAIEEAVAGLTHDIKNFSSMIASETQWLEKLDRDDRLDFAEVKKSMKEINSYVEKIEDFTGNLKRRAYKLPPQTSWFTLHIVIEEAVRLISNKASRSGVKIQKIHSDFDIQLRGDSGLLVRAFFNIMTNAIDAMPDGGILKISAQHDHKQVQIDFSDTGTGISEQDLGRVFNPFFSTKEKGYGLGLAITKRIIETDHRGKLFLRSKAGEGTIAEVWLPLHSDVHRKSKVDDRIGNILVVNDNTAVLDKITQVLDNAGYHVTSTECGEVAVGFCQEQPFDAIVIDYHLNKDRSATQTAGDFIPELKKLAPATPIILASASLGHSTVPEMQYDFFLEINHAFWNEIIELISKLLQKRPAPRWN
ncbi:MAG: GAF domain-containing protein [bacterium]